MALKKEIIKSLKGRDLICTQDWSREELDTVLELAHEMKADRFGHRYAECLKKKTFFMFFYNPSVRTRQSFECALTDLGGHAQFLEPKAMRLKTKTSAGEIVKDAGEVMSRYAQGLGIRILEDAIEKYGQGEDLLREYAHWCSMPVISMAHDKYHPCQSLADMQGLQEHMKTREMKGKKILIHWGYSTLVRSWCSVQGSMLLNTRFGMDVTVAHPPGFDLDPEVMETCRKNAEAAGGKFTITEDLDRAYEGVDVVYSRHWMSPRRYSLEKEDEKKLSEPFKNWRCTAERMKKTNNAYFIHPMPVDRGNEVDDEVADSPRSIIVDIAENRLHAQKAILALTMGDLA